MTLSDLDAIRARIATIDELLVGPKSTSIGDRRVDYDMQALKDERETLMRIVSSSTNSQYRRVVFKNA